MGIGDGGAAICVAPVKGATQGVSADILLHIKFQSALPAKRATSRTPRNPVCSSNFNPRSREGSDVDAVAAVKLVEKISIHAPAKGATLTGRSTTKHMEYFNPRSREGSDTMQAAVTVMWLVFQSTLPRRERRFASNLAELLHYISIHAPAKGATAKITKTIPNDFYKINNYNNSFA